VPLTALLKIVLESNPETRAYAALLAAKPRGAHGWLGRRLRSLNAQYVHLGETRRSSTARFAGIIMDRIRSEARWNPPA
jgi:hypothetical protein